jgi:hypothetical protein
LPEQVVVGLDPKMVEEVVKLGDEEVDGLELSVCVFEGVGDQERAIWEVSER